VWATFTGALDAAPLLQATYFYALAVLCEMWSPFRRAMRDVDARGHLVKSIRNEGDMVKNPSCLEAARALTAWSSLAGKFGFTPADRAGTDLRKPAPPELSPLEQVRQATRRTWHT
jgi:phage terminase small subunit